MSETGRYALIICNSEYEDPKLAALAAPEVDGAALAGVLRDPEIGGFDAVNMLTNVTAQEARIAIENFFAEKGLNDLLLLYFTGHGVLDRNNRLYLAARDTRFRTDPLLLRKATAIESSFIRDEMNQTRSRRIVLVLDCCHGGAFEAGAMSATDVQVGTGAAFEGNGIGRVILTASDATQFAWQGDAPVVGQPASSVFTRAIVEGLRSGDADVDNDGKVSVHELYEYVQRRVKELASDIRPQTPRMWTYGQRGAFLIARAARREEAARERYRDIVRLVQDEDWPAAAEKWRVLREQFPPFQDDYQVGERITQWQQAQVRYREMQRLVLARRGGEALAVWATIKKAFPHFADTRHLVREAEEAVKEQQQRQWLDQRYAQMHVLCNQKQWGQALQVWQSILDVDPYYPDHRQLAQRAQEAQSERQRQEDAQALRRRLDMVYAEMEKLVAQKQWKKAEERWQMIRGFDQSYEDTKKLAPQVRVGLREVKLQWEARERRLALDTRYREVLGYVQRQEWQAALQAWQAIIAVDENYADHENVLPLIGSHLGPPQGAELRAQPQEGKKRRGCMRPLLIVSALGVLSLVGIAAAVIVLLSLAQRPGGSPTPSTGEPRLLVAPASEIEPEETPLFATPDQFNIDDSIMPTPLIPATAGCPFVVDGFALFVNVPYGPFYTASGLSYVVGYDGYFIYTLDSFGNWLTFSLPRRNEWISFEQAPFAACVDDSGQHYAWFDPGF